MKKTLLYILIIIIIFSITGCNNNNQEVKEGKLSIVTTIFPQYDFMRQICGNLADIELLIQPGTDSHNYEPTPQDIIKISKCDLFIYTGGENDEWVRTILHSSEMENINAVSLSGIVPFIKEEEKEGMHVEDDHHQQHITQFDEHVWTSPENAIKICNELTSYVCNLDEDNIPVYKENCEKYVSEIDKLNKEAKEIVVNAKRNTIVFADRFPIGYFTNQFGIEYFAAFPGCAQQVEPAPSTLMYLIDKVKKENIPVVFYREFSDQKVADMICEETNAKKLLFHSCHNISSDEFKSGATYISLMKTNIQNLKEALN